MSKIIKRSHTIIKKIGKRNFILFFFVLISLVIAGLYNTFSLNTEISQSFVDGIKTYQFIINSSNNKNSITIAEKSKKNITIKISNPDNTRLQDGLDYSSNEELTNTYLG